MSEPKTEIWIYVNGILVLPGDAKAWTDRAVIWTHLNTPDCGEKFEYAAGPFQWFNMTNRRVDDLLWLTRKYITRGWTVHWVGHSNGADIICKALQEKPPQLESVTLIAPACEADMKKNGLNTALYDGTVRRLAVHIAEEDRAMKLAKLSLLIGGWLGLGFGNMGGKGPRNVKPEVAPRLTVQTWEGYGHSTFFESKKFDATFRAIHRLTNPAS